MNEEEKIKNIEEILELCREELPYNEDISATLDCDDLESLECLYKMYHQEKEKNKKLEEQRKIDENSVIDLITQLNAEVERCCDLSAELDEASKVINLMAEDFKKDVEILFDTNKDIQDIKAYYFNKLKESKNE